MRATSHGWWAVAMFACGPSDAPSQPNMGGPCEGAGDCGAHASCVPGDAGHACRCDDGWAGDGQVCRDRDECLEDTHACATPAACANTEGSYACVCPDGFVSDGHACQDIDECAQQLHICDANADCINDAGSYSCACKQGFAGDGKRCTPNAACSGCHEHATCEIDDQDQAICTCRGGYQGDGHFCEAVPTGCGDCGVHAHCRAETSTCDCDAGYAEGEQGCTDFDECAAGTHDCDANAACTNTDGAFACACNAGFTGDGRTCASTCSGAMAYDDGACRTQYSLIVSGGHMCAVRTDSALFCWGWNGNGQLGRGDYADKNIPSRVGPNVDWRLVTGGGAHTCGVRGAALPGALYCWGSGRYGQLGTGDPRDVTMPAPVGSAADWRFVVAGGAHTCGIRTPGKLYCWGQNLYGQIGDGTAGDIAPLPTQIGAATDWSTVGAGTNHSCGLKTTGTLWCWGYNQEGQLGVSNTLTPARTAPAQSGTDTDWQSLAVGANHACAVKRSGTVSCWGQNSSGQIGNGATGVAVFTPTAVAGEGGWTLIGAGGQHTCGIRAPGHLFCWGNNMFGQLGDGTITQRTSPVRVGVASDWSAIAAGAVCGLRSTGSPWCWGSNHQGQLGNGKTGGYGSSSPVRPNEPG